jgi:PleD family two-component response regulator
MITIGCKVRQSFDHRKGKPLRNERRRQCSVPTRRRPKGQPHFYGSASGCPRSLVILIVGYADIDPLSAALSAGVDEIVYKPFPETEPLDRIATNFKEFIGQQPKRSI